MINSLFENIIVNKLKKNLIKEGKLDIVVNEIYRDVIYIYLYLKFIFILFIIILNYIFQVALYIVKMLIINIINLINYKFK